jgi:hypothetical protein
LLARVPLPKRAANRNNEHDGQYESADPESATTGDFRHVRTNEESNRSTLPRTATKRDPRRNHSHPAQENANEPADCAIQTQRLCHNADAGKTEYSEDKERNPFRGSQLFWIEVHKHGCTTRYENQRKAEFDGGL